MESPEFIGIPIALAGVILLFMGRKLFWLLVAAAGFLAGFLLSQYFITDFPHMTALIVGLALGIVGAVLTLLAQKIAIGVGGFLAGGYVLMVLAGGAEATMGVPPWIPFLIGGILGALLLKQVFEWTLIVLTAILGALMVVEGFGLAGSTAFFSGILLAAIGFVWQSRSKLGRKR